VHYARFLSLALTSQIKKNRQKIATEQIKTATRSKTIIFKTRETQTKAPGLGRPGLSTSQVPWVVPRGLPWDHGGRPNPDVE
jgi:hypothetical protein